MTIPVPRARKTQEGITALAYAASRGHVDCLRELIIGGADKNSQNYVRCCLLDTSPALGVIFASDEFVSSSLQSKLSDLILVSFSHEMHDYADCRSP